MSQRRWFLASVVSSELVVGIFFDRFGVGANLLQLRPLGRRGFDLPRWAVDVLEFERQWLPPFWWKTVVRIRLTEGDYAPKVAIPLRSRPLRRALVEKGWRVRSVQVGSTEPRRERRIADLPTEPGAQG